MKNLRTVLMVAGLGIVIVLVPPLVTAQDEFTDEFTGGIDLDNWRVYSNQPLFTIDDSADNVLMSKPFGGNGWGHWDFVFLCFEGEVTGNFTASIDFSELNLDLSDVGCNAISIENFFGGQVHALVRQECENGGDTVGVWLDPPEVWLGDSNDASAGTLTVRRSGMTVTSEFTDIENQTVGVHEDEFNGAAVTDLCFGLGNNNSLDAVSVRFDKFRVVTANAIVYPTEQWRNVLVDTSTEDRAPDFGSDNTALAFAPEGSELALAYTDFDTKEVKVARATRIDAQWIWSPSQVAAQEGRAVDLGYDACGRLWISYLSGPSNKGYLRLAEWDGNSWIEHAVDRGGQRFVTSLAHEPSGCGPPSVTYGAESGNEGQLRFAEGELPPVVVDSGAGANKGESDWPRAGVGGFSSLAYTPEGYPAVAYSHIDESGCSTVRFASRTDGAWDTEVVADWSGRYLREISLAYGSDGRPMIAFTDASPQPLVFCERSEENGWACSELHPGSFSHPNVVVDGNGNFTLGAHKWGPNFDPELWLYRGPPTEGSWHVERVRWFAADDATLDPNGNPAFSYRDGAEVYFAFLDGMCESNESCNDGSPCTDDTCQAGSCVHDVFVDGSDCEGEPGVCCAGQCVTPQCTVDADCNDGDECTFDTCVIGGNPPCSSYCQHEPDPSCEECVPTHSKEKGPRCTDGIDNDCDGLTDGDDPDC